MSTVAARENSHIKTFSVGVFGLDGANWGVLERILSVAKVRRRGYQLVNMDIESPELFRHVDFVMVNTCNIKVVQAWRHLSQKLGALGRRRVIKLVSSDAALSGGYSLQIPINPSRVLKMFDAYTIRELNYFPEFEIGAERQQDKDVVRAGIKLLNTRCDGKINALAIKALVVDDSMPVRRQLEIEFGLMSADVESVASGEEALELVCDKEFDVIFLDVVMGGMDGYSVCKKIRAEGLNRKTPVTLLTSKSSSFDKLKGTLAGCNAYLTKPINHNEFTDVIHRFLKKS